MSIRNTKGNFVSYMAYQRGGQPSWNDDENDEEGAHITLCLNQDVARFNSPIKKIAFTLMLIKGPDTAGWTRDMGDFLDGLMPVDNIQYLTYGHSFWRNSGSNSRTHKKKTAHECRWRNYG
jgi:hypothetical protein